MPRFYVQHEGKWNIFSTIVDDFLLPRFLTFEELKQWVIADTIVERERELNTLLTEFPKLNVMSHEEAMAKKMMREEWERRDENRPMEE